MSQCDSQNQKSSVFWTLSSGDSINVLTCRVQVSDMESLFWELICYAFFIFLFGEGSIDYLTANFVCLLILHSQNALYLAIDSENQRISTENLTTGIAKFSKTWWGVSSNYMTLTRKQQQLSTKFWEKLLSKIHVNKNLPFLGYIEFILRFQGLWDMYLTQKHMFSSSLPCHCRNSNSKRKRKMFQYLSIYQSIYLLNVIYGGGNGNPLQCSCLENPRDGGAWWAAVYGVAQSRIQLKRLSSRSSSSIDVETRVRIQFYVSSWSFSSDDGTSDINEGVSCIWLWLNSHFCNGHTSRQSYSNNIH